MVYVFDATIASVSKIPFLLNLCHETLLNSVSKCNSVFFVDFLEFATCQLQK
jgi:hypothetical protein